MSELLKKIIVCTAAIACVVSTSLTVNAQANAQGLIISPPLYEKTVNRGEVLTQSIKLTNPTNNELMIKVKVVNFSANDESGQPKLHLKQGEDDGYGLADWISVEKQFSLNSLEKREISYQVHVPAGAEPGNHFGSIVFSPTASSATGNDGSGATLASEVGALIMLTVNGDIVNDGKIVEFRPLRKIDLSGNNKAGFIIRFQNNGNVHLKPTGEIFINNIFGRKVATLRVNEDAGNVLPNSIRKFQIDWDKYNRFGRYTAQAGLIYGDGKSATGKTVFWVIPLKETLITIAVLLIIFRAIRRNTKKRK